MSDVWDRTSEVIAGRAGILAGIAALTIFLPSALDAAGEAFAPDTGGWELVKALIGLAAGLLAVFGSLAMVAVASDPSVDAGAGWRIAARRFGPALGMVALLVVAFLLLLTPGLILLGASGVDVSQAQARRMPVEGVDPGLFLFASAVLIATLVAALWLSARFFPLLAVVVNERLGVGALRRTLALTRGRLWRIVGVLLLYVVVFLVVLLAASSIVGVAAGLILGDDGRATASWLAALAGAAVTAVATVVQMAFVAQYYLAAREQPPA